MPSAVPSLAASSTTSQSWATRCIQVPVLETTPPDGVQAVVVVVQGAERGAQLRGQSLDQWGGLAQQGAFFGGQLAQPLGEPGVATAPVGEQGRPALVGEVDQHLAAVGRVRPAYGVPVVDEAVDRAGHRRRLHPLVGGERTDGALALAEQDAQRAQGPHAQRVVRVALVAQATREPRDGEPELAGEPGVGAGGCLDGGMYLA